MNALRTHEQSMRAEADRWRSGIRSGEIQCRCRESGQLLDELHHRIDRRCAWEYGVARVYELERALEAA